MNNPSAALQKILNAREDRAFLRSGFAQSGYCTISLSLNIPAYPKSDNLIERFFSEVLIDLKNFLKAYRLILKNNLEINKIDEAGHFYIIPFVLKNKSLKELKRNTEEFERKHPLGRLIDVDLFDNGGKPLSSGKEKPCYYCGKYSAVSCMREKRHSYSEIRHKISIDIDTYLKSLYKTELVNKLVSLSMRAVLYEVTLSPKPGLVDFQNTGSHEDMNIFTFITSSTTLIPFFKDYCLLGYNYKGKLKNALAKIRTIGLKAEKAMYEATNGINTQKGIIFLFGICLFSISKLVSEKRTFSYQEFQNIVKEIAENIVKTELEDTTPETHGEIVYSKYRVIGAGARHEVESGFKTVFNTAIPYLSEVLQKEIYTDQKKLQEILLTALLKIMTENNDSNILFRSDKNTLNSLKKLAKNASKNRDEYIILSRFCSESGISPGGSADLLAVSLLLHFVKTELTHT